MSADLVIANGLVVLPDRAEPADVVVKGDTIAGIAEPGGGRGERIIDASGRVVLAGGVDAHVHFLIGFMGQRSVYDFHSGTVAALRGGATSVIDFALQRRGRSLVDGLKHRRVQADRHVATDYGLHVIVTDVGPETPDELDRIRDLGVTSLKVYMTYEAEQLKVEDGPLFELMQAAGRRDMMVGLHAENDSIITREIKRCLEAGQTSPVFHARTRPTIAETEAVSRALLLGEAAGCPTHIFHLSAGSALDQVAAARARGLPVFAETCPHYLALDNTAYEHEDGHLFVMSPPLRNRANIARLWHGLVRGEIAAVTSDDASYPAEAKAAGRESFDRIANGVPGVETRLPVLYTLGVATGAIDLVQLSRLFSEWPARLFGLAPKKGEIAPGADADLVVIDPETERVMTPAGNYGPIGYTPFDGLPLRGWPVLTVRRGEVAVEQGRFLGKAGDGRYLERTPGDFGIGR